MKIGVSSTGRDLSADMDPRFGRAAYFLIIEPETMKFEVLENRQNLDLPQGAGIQAGKTIADKKVDVLITGNCGPKAFMVLQHAGVKVITGAKGRVEDIIRQYQNGEFKPAQAPNVDGHWV
jgi:predicted Fe-Mo cluster-binding NifX family protein